jgi:hypothetical protein
MSIFARLNFNFPDPAANTAVSNFTPEVNKQMSLMPPLLNSWQTSDIGSNSVSGYFQNPVSDVCQNIWDTSNSIFFLTDELNGSNAAITALLANTYLTANVISTTTVNHYLYITNRQSNVSPLGNDRSTPHYQTAIGVGKMMTHITNQSDGVQNNAPIIGNFTSILIGNTLNSLYNSIHNDMITLMHSIGSNTAQSNISYANAVTLNSDVANVYATMTSFPANDTAFFNNSQAIMNDFSTVRQFNTIGQTESQLINMTGIGTSKLTDRLNS